jgi:hypothetical protein
MNKLGNAIYTTAKNSMFDVLREMQPEKSVITNTIQNDNISILFDSLNTSYDDIEHEYNCRNIEKLYISNEKAAANLKAKNFEDYAKLRNQAYDANFYEDYPTWILDECEQVNTVIAFVLDLIDTKTMVKTACREINKTYNLLEETDKTKAEFVKRYHDSIVDGIVQNYRGLHHEVQYAIENREPGIIMEQTEIDDIKSFVSFDQYFENDWLDGIPAKDKQTAKEFDNLLDSLNYTDILKCFDDSMDAIDDYYRSYYPEKIYNEAKETAVDFSGSYYKNEPGYPEEYIYEIWADENYHMTDDFKNMVYNMLEWWTPEKENQDGETK